MAKSAGADELESIYREHFEMVWRGLRRLGVSTSLVDDATQDVFLVVHRRLSDFEERSSLRSWIFGIAVHMARYYRRLDARNHHTEPASTVIDQVTRDPYEQLENQRAVQLMYNALNRMSESHREVFVLADVEGLTGPEIASMLKIPENTVYSRLHHARIRFEAILSRLQREPERLR